MLSGVLSRRERAISTASVSSKARRLPRPVNASCRASLSVSSAVSRWRLMSNRAAHITKPTTTISNDWAASRPAAALVPPSRANGIQSAAAANTTTGKLRRGGFTAAAPAQTMNRSAYAEVRAPVSPLSTATPPTTP